jgi:DNA-binding LacI/PurR family transcriptional regulator
MADVAKLAGVSHQTVSRVINNSEHVRPETRDRVIEAMRLLDYRPNPLARALVTGRSRTLGVVSFDTTLFGPASTLFGIERAAHAAGYGVSVISVVEINRASVLSAIERLLGHAVDGVVIISPQSEAVSSILELPPEVPIVSVVAGPDEGAAVVEVDQFAGAQFATRHLLELGHKTVWHISGPSDFLEAQQRIEGWRAALLEAAAPLPPILVGDWSAESGYQLGRQLAEDPEVTAVFVANDPMALGLLRVLHEAGRRVPEDVSIVGFDDVPESSYFTPPLTTVRQDFLEVGRSSFALLLDEIESGRRSSTRVRVSPSLIVRESTAAPTR